MKSGSNGEMDDILNQTESKDAAKQGDSKEAAKKGTIKQKFGSFLQKTNKSGGPSLNSSPETNTMNTTNTPVITAPVIKEVASN